MRSRSSITPIFADSALGATSVTNGGFENGYDGSNNDPIPEGWFTQVNDPSFWRAACKDIGSAGKA